MVFLYVERFTSVKKSVYVLCSLFSMTSNQSFFENHSKFTPRNTPKSMSRFPRPNRKYECALGFNATNSWDFEECRKVSSGLFERIGRRQIKLTV